MTMLLEVLGEAFLYLILLLLVGGYGIRLWLRGHSDVINDIRASSDRGNWWYFFWTTFTDRYWPIRIGRRTWVGYRIVRVSMAYNKGAGFIIALWSGPMRIGSKIRSSERELLWHWNIRWYSGLESYWLPIRKVPRTEEPPRCEITPTQDDDFIF